MNRRGYACLFFVFLLFASFIGRLPVEVARAEDYFTRHYAWVYDGRTWTWDLSIPLSLYNLYKEFVPQTERVARGVAGYGSLVTTEDTFMMQVADGLHSSAQSMDYNYYDEVNFVLAFVQSLPYVSDSETTGYSEYPRFPIETLVDGGDCEDTSILFATLLTIINYAVILISFPSHMTAGVWGHEAYPGWYISYEGKRYYFCETTGQGWRMGDLPSEYRNVEATVIPINEWEQFKPLEKVEIAIDQAYDKITAARFISPEANDLLQRARSEYDLAVSCYNSGDYVEAFTHAQNAIDYVDRAQVAEDNFLRTLTIVGLIGVAVIVTIIAVVAVTKARQKTVYACPRCQGPLRYLPQYQRWYCDRCKQYA